MIPCHRILHMYSLIWDKPKVSRHKYSPMLQWVSIRFLTTRYVLKTVHCRSIKNITPLATFPSTLHQALFRPPFPIRLFTESLPPTLLDLVKQKQKISDNLPVVVSTTPMHGLIRSPWNLPLLVELKWRSYSRPPMISEAVFGCSFAPSQNYNEGVEIEDRSKSR